MIYSEKLIELRETKNLKIQDISKILELEKDTYGKYEREYVIIPINHLNKICNYYNVSLDYIFGFSDKKQHKDSIKNVDAKMVGKRLKEFRKENKLTQEKLASILNTNQSVIANYERGRNIIATPFLYEICKKYKVSADYLLGKISNPTYFK